MFKPIGTLLANGLQPGEGKGLKNRNSANDTTSVGLDGLVVSGIDDIRLLARLNSDDMLAVASNANTILIQISLLLAVVGVGKDDGIVLTRLLGLYTVPLPNLCPIHGYNGRPENPAHSCAYKLSSPRRQLTNSFGSSRRR